ncbi:MAG: tRNA-dihydrouridine synthase [bacterium]
MATFWQKLNIPIIGLSPMDGYTDAPFRYIVAKYGKPDVIYTEFVSIDGLVHHAERVFQDMKYQEIERPIVVQFFGIDPDCFYQAAQIGCLLGFDGIDINMGCPAKTVAARGAGAGLIRNPELVKNIITATHAGIADWQKGLINLDSKELILIEQIKNTSKIYQYPEHQVAVSVKTRLGFDNETVEEWIGFLVQQNLAAIALHGRTFKEMYRGKADWEAIARAATLVNQYNVGHSTPTKLLGNGDLVTIDQIAKTVQKYPELDGFLVGRGVLGNPWLFEDYRSFAITGVILEHSIAAKIQLALDHSLVHSQLKSTGAFVQIRKHLGWYIRDFPHASELRQLLMQTRNYPEIAQILQNYLDNFVANK